MKTGDEITRRRFLAVSAGSVAGAFLAGRRGDAAQAQPMRFSASTVMYKDCDIREAVEEIAKTGCQAVDVWEVSGHMEWIEKNRGEYLRQLLDSYGLELFSFSIYFTPGPKRLNRLELLKECGGSVAVLGGGGGRTVSQAVAGLRPLVEKAEELGVKIAGENHGHTVLDSIESLREFAALAKSPALGIALAPYHVMRRKESVAEAVQAVGEKLFYFYAWQHAPGMRQLPGDGTLDFGPVIAALRKIKYNGYLNIFTHAHVPKDEMTRAVIESRRYLEALGSKL